MYSERADTCVSSITFLEHFEQTARITYSSSPRNLVIHKVPAARILSGLGGKDKHMRTYVCKSFPPSAEGPNMK